MRRWVWLLGVLALLGGADTAYWRIAANRLREGYVAWAATARAAGWTVESGAAQAGGWPLAATLVLPSASLGSASAALAWSADQVTLRVSLLRPALLEIFPLGGQRLRLGQGPALAYTADALRIDMPLDAAPGTGDLLARDLRIGPSPAADGTVAAGPAEQNPLDGLTVGLLKGHLAPVEGQSPPATGFLVAAEAIGLPPRALQGLTDALGTRISSSSVEGSVTGPAPLPTAPAAWARIFRDTGGRLDIGRLALGWGPLGVSLTAGLGLDAALQPAGNGDAHIVGFARTLDALAASHAIGAHVALAGKALLGLVAQPAGGADAVDLKLGLHDRTLSLRDVPLLRLPSLDW